MGIMSIINYFSNVYRENQDALLEIVEYVFDVSTLQCNYL